MRFALLLFAATAFAQDLPVLPAVSPLGAQDVTCLVSVLDNQTSVEMECSAAGILSRSTHAPSERGAVLGTGPVLCLLWSRAGVVRLQCAADYGMGPVAVLDGILKPIPRKRTWK